MPGLYQITANFFLGVISRLGVRPPPPEAFLLSNIVQPVSIVDADISIPAFATTPTLGVPFSQGDLAAPAATTLAADTGQQPAGIYSVTVFLACANEVGVVSYFLARRNAANGADIWVAPINNGTQGSPAPFSCSVRLELNERIIVRVGPQNAGAASIHRASIFLS